MAGIRFEWDRKKESANWRKHRVGFTEATSVFGDPLSITVSDPEHSAEEDRLVTVGMSINRRLLIVIHTVREERLRLISARLATKHERNQYEENSL